MRIVHFHNVAGVATTLSKYQKRIGHNSKVLVSKAHPFGYPGEIIHATKAARLVDGLSSMLFSSVIHYHESPYASLGIDYRIASKLRKEIVFHFHGAELRVPNLRQKALKFFSERIIVSTPDLLKYASKGATWLPNPIDTELFYPNRSVTSDALNIGYYDPVSSYVSLFHASGNLLESATKSIPRALIKLSAARKIPWTRMPAYFNNLDIWIDKIGMNFYGLAACEASACKVPVITQIGEEESTYLPDCPFITTKIEHLKDAIEYLSEENTRRYVDGKCFDYVNRLHAASDVVERLDAFYDS